MVKNSLLSNTIGLPYIREIYALVEALADLRSSSLIRFSLDAVRSVCGVSLLGIALYYIWNRFASKKLWDIGIQGVHVSTISISLDFCRCVRECCGDAAFF